MKVLGWLLLVVFCFQAGFAWRRGRVATFSKLPLPFPESISYGNGLFFTAHAQLNASVGQIAVTRADGSTLKVVTVPGTQGALTGIYYRAEQNDVLVCDSMNGRVVAVDPITEVTKEFLVAPRKGFLNDLTRDRQGNWYVSDSFLGLIWKANPDGSNVRVWSDNSNLSVNGSFGANGLAFSLDESILYVNNFGTGKAYKIAKTTNGEAGEVNLFAESIAGNDALRVDNKGNVWIISNQVNQIWVFNPQGELIAIFGDTEGVDESGVIRGLLGSSSFVFVNSDVYLCNFAPGGDNDPLGYLKRQVRTWTIAKILSPSLNRPFRERTPRV